MHTRCISLLGGGITAVMVGLLTLLPASPALAHGEEDAQSRTFVLQALAYLANQPAGYPEAVADKVADALAASDKAGIDPAKVEAAKAALDAHQETAGMNTSGHGSAEAGESETEGVVVVASDEEMEPLDPDVLLQVRTLLQESVEPLTGPVTGSEPGTTTMLDPMPGNANWGGTSLVFAVLSVAAVLGGLLLARRWRSAFPLRDIRAQLTERGIR